MTARYYENEHESAYWRIEREGLTQWADLFGESHEPGGFANREFLERALPTLSGLPDEAHALEYGCGTGFTACFLAEQGFHVTAIDLVPRAIDLAQRFSQERGVQVDFAVQDICDWPTEGVEQNYHLIVDSYCLQSIVLDEDRRRVFAGVRARLRPAGYYLISTAMYDKEREYEDGFSFDPATGICCEVSAQGGLLPHRRHLTPLALRQELERSGFRILMQEGRLGGDLVCALD